VICPYCSNEAEFVDKNDNLRTYLDAAINKINKLRDENDRLRKALKFYSYEGNYLHEYEHIKVLNDGGKKAREALK